MTLEGPLIEDKTSFIISARRTYADLIVKPFLSSSTNLSLYFYDLNAKLNHKISEKDRIFLSTYIGDDNFSVNFDENDILNEQASLSFGLGYGNITVSYTHLTLPTILLV